MIPSNSGFCALVGMATALSGDGGRRLTAEQVQSVAPRLRELFGAQQLTAGSSGWLRDEYAKRARDPHQRQRGGGVPDPVLGPARDHDEDAPPPGQPGRPARRRVHRNGVFPPLFGKNNEGEMTALAQLTGGRVFDARSVPLAQAFTVIRGYQ